MLETTTRVPLAHAHGTTSLSVSLKCFLVVQLWQQLDILPSSRNIRKFLQSADQEQLANRWHCLQPVDCLRSYPLRKLKESNREPDSWPSHT